MFDSPGPFGKLLRFFRTRMQEQRRYDMAVERRAKVIRESRELEEEAEGLRLRQRSLIDLATIAQNNAVTCEICDNLSYVVNGRNIFRCSGCGRQHEGPVCEDVPNYFDLETELQKVVARIEEITARKKELSDLLGRQS